jgi:enoyl-CoA hydratase/carnithine racemase
VTDAEAGTDVAGDAVLADRDGDGVLTLTFNRPERRNGWAEDLQQAYLARLAEAAADERVRAVVVTGAGSTFCPGADLSRLGALGEEGARLPHQPVDVQRRFPKPLIAAINGACAGVGLVQALFCHVRFAADTARFSTAFARRGLIAEYGVAWTLTRLVGQERALDLLLSARTFDAAEARELGLVSRVVPRDEVLGAAQAYARDLALNCSPRAMAVIASQVLDAQDSTFDEALQTSYEHVDRFIGSADLREGVSSFVERRPPRFAPLGPFPDSHLPHHRR